MKKFLRLKKRADRKKFKKLPFVAVTDSGAGGLCAFLKLRQAFPSLNLLYVSDRKNMPYGQKFGDEILALCKANYKKAKAVGAVALVVACNTMSRMGKNFFLSCKTPCFFIEPPVGEIRKFAKSEKCAVFCTVATARDSEINTLSREKNCYVFPQKLLAQKIEKALDIKAKKTFSGDVFDGKTLKKINFECGCVEKLKFSSEGNRLKSSGGGKRAKASDISFKDEGFFNEFKKVYLCCTHYIYVKNEFRQKFKNAQISEDNEDIIKKLREFLVLKTQRSANDSLFLSKTKFIGSGKTVIKRLYYKSLQSLRNDSF